MSALALAPDGNTLVFGIGYEDLAANSSNTDLYLLDVAGGTPRRITDTPKSEGAPCGLPAANA